jgi:epoxyqueuosine reductase QueG
LTELHGGRSCEELKDELRDWLRNWGAFEVRVADPRSPVFDHALERRKPLELWPDCRSLIVFGTSMPPDANNIYAGPYSPFEGERNTGPVPEAKRSPDHAMDRLSRLFLSSVMLRCVLFVDHYGYRWSASVPQAKLSGVAAGLGVYGRSGLLIHPVLGCRIDIGVLPTDMPLEFDPPLEGFDPCGDCSVCIDECPASAYDPADEYPDSWTRETCLRYRADLSKDGIYCHNCMALCPASQLEDESLLRIARAVTLHDGDSPD